MPPGADDQGWEGATLGDVIAASVLLALLAPLAYRTAAALAAGGHGLALAAALLLGVLAADFVGGCVHWLADTFFAEDTPLIGKVLIEPFREHHRDPLAMTRRSFLRVGNSNVVATSVMLVVVWYWRRGSAPGVFTDAWITTLAGALWLTNQFHKWAHVSRVPPAVAWLQATGLILTPARHARHHTGSHTRGFCVTNGWLNPVLDRVGVFTAAERLIRARKATRAFDA